MLLGENLIIANLNSLIIISPIPEIEQEIFARKAVLQSKIYDFEHISPNSRHRETKARGKVNSVVFTVTVNQSRIFNRNEARRLTVNYDIE